MIQIEALNAELDDQKDAFVAEQLRVSHLTKLNKVHHLDRFLDSTAMV